MNSDSERHVGHEGALDPVLEKSWVGSVCAYFRDFLDTNFQRTRAPKRSISSRDSNNNLTSVALSKYPDLEKDIWGLLNSPLDQSHSHKIAVRSGKYRSRLKKSLNDVIVRQIDNFKSESATDIASHVKAQVRHLKVKLADDAEEFAKISLHQIRQALLNAVVNPLLGNLDAFYKSEGSDSYEKLYDLEEELGALLIEGFKESVSPAVAQVLVDNDFTDLDQLIEEATESNGIKDKFLDFFSSYATSDFFNELTSLRTTVSLKENFQLYIYVSALRFNSTSYPLFYFPITVSLKQSAYTIEVDPHLLINKKAIQFATQEVGRAINKTIAFNVEDRIVYVGEGSTFVEHIQEVMDQFTASMSLNGAIKFSKPQYQKVSRDQIDIDNSLYFSAFDTADESLLNDYEDLLTTLGEGSPESADFEQLISKFMDSDPASYEDEVEKEWRSKSMQERLVYDSPVPLNEEQQKVIAALNKPDCRFIAVEGPPGTGKSHTITACVFDAILRNKNVLILSDKKEALDVAENKIRQTLAKVRLEENLQDPILRLGKHGSSYAKILSTKTISQLQRSLQVARDGSAELDRSIDDAERNLKGNIVKQGIAETEINLPQIVSLECEERNFEYIDPDTESLFQSKTFCEGVKASQVVLQFIMSDLGRRLIEMAGGETSEHGLERFFLKLEGIVNAINSLESLEDFQGFGRFDPNDISRLSGIADTIESARMPIFGYLFSKSKLQKASRNLKDTFDYADADEVLSVLGRLRLAESTSRALLRALVDANVVEAEMQKIAFFLTLKGVNRSNPLQSSASSLRVSFAVLCEAMAQESEYFGKIGLTFDTISLLVREKGSEVADRIRQIAEHVKALDSVSEAFSRVPEFDYAGEREQLERYQTQKLANILDERVVNFANTKKNKARQIKDIIKRKQRFPKDLFSELRSAFPVMIAGIRDYAEYVPLQKYLFDLIIIDEASQVSIAQALPAFIRAKKVLVLGDKNQFSNVKTERASNMINQAYRSKVVEQFHKDSDRSHSQINQIKMFDIKTSVLDFVERIANLQLMLRKHFRGYPELIGFSSKYFYDNQLQAVKVRGKSIEHVLEFREVEHDDLVEPNSKTNSLEADQIIDELVKLSKEEKPQDCCVITPHTEQQRLIMQKLTKIPQGQEIIEKLRFRAFTFDTCQGEERDTVIYSMVASRCADRLKWIFPKDLDQSGEVEENLRLQRLNVGFSRAKERIIIFHSKPIEEFNGSIGMALRHYADVRERAKGMPTAADVDPTSPPELKVLGWLHQVPVLEELSDQVEVDAQFELGKYLRQLDPTYDHPKYRVDFLIKISGATKSIKIILEYDGFKEHFTNLDEVDASNYESYRKPSDVERQKILEGYGYKFLRINRFNVGDDPIGTLDKRLRRLIKDVDFQHQPPKLIEKYRVKQAALASGKSKVCPKCGHVLKKESFYDHKLKQGKGGYGRVCVNCKHHGSGRT